jgi:glycosyltransferase involved in cell wall biosynthesis
MKMKVSVCMAVYNGAEYLRAQIDSILVQLREFDELVVVDDASEDGSVAILQRVDDSRLRVHRSAVNAGVVRTFELALSFASGDIIFLSDQDDLWLAGKVSAVLDVFTSRPEVTMVVTDARVIDGDGRTINRSFFSMRGRFNPGPLHNLVKNKYLGCALAFRREMLSIFLPIPADVPMHDIWFGVLNGIYGRTYFIDEPLVDYRRHSRNASSVVPLSAGLGKAALWRYRLAKNLALRIISRSLRSA